MEKNWKLKGRVVSGAMKASFFTQLDWVQEQCMEKLGFRPYPGTLNLELSEEGLQVMEALQQEEGVSLIPPDPEFCAAEALPLLVGTISGAIIMPAEDVRIHGKSIVEVLASEGLRDALDLHDGDLVTIIVSRPG
ncbi:MAG: CTP-dependent riboflavin kinase [Deltaproteobacteria bacterium]|nr:CTP-dependent riboflavin kinase [Deltaproteobacteria bacterium]